MTRPDPRNRRRKTSSAANSTTPFAAAHGLVRQGVGNGTEPLPENRRNRTTGAADEHPWKVYALAQSEDVDHCFEICIPDGVVHVGETEIDVEGVTAVTGSTGRYTVDCESEIEDDGEFILAVYREDDGESSAASSDDETPEWTAKIVSSAESVEDAAAVLALLPIAAVSIDSSGDYPVGSVNRQLVRSAVAFTEEGAVPDDVSIGTVTDEEAEDPSALQVKDFDNDESDGGHGLAERLKVVRDGDESYKIEAESNESTVHLVARVNGKIKYIPLTGSEEMDEDEEDPDAGDPCAHDKSGGSGGVSPDDEDAEDGQREGGAAGFGDGGVSANGDSHKGDDNCNCN